MEATHRNSASWYVIIFVLVSFSQPNTSYSFMRRGNFNTVRFNLLDWPVGIFLIND